MNAIEPNDKIGWVFRWLLEQRLNRRGPELLKELGINIKSLDLILEDTM